MKAKPKICKRCEKEKRIFSQGLCDMCHRVTYPEKYMIKRAEAKAKKKPKLEPISKLEKKLDKVFSEYIRLRYADEFGFVECFTSGVVKHWTSQHCGHFQSRRHRATRWNEKNCQVQSVAENIFNQGNQYTFGKNLDLKYGKGTADKLEKLAKSTIKISRNELNYYIEDYTEKVNKLKEKINGN